MDPRRLCHISDLPNNLHFLPIEIKHLLPVHHNKFIENLHTIIANQSKLLKWNVYPDLALTLSNVQYVVVSGGWCEDIDGRQQHLKSSLELAAIILNYLYSHFQAAPLDQEVIESTALKRVEHIGCEKKIINIRLQTVLAYNIYKTKDKEQKTKFIFLLGQQKSSEAKIFSIVSSVRHWNLHRLKIDSCQKISPYRFDKQIEHLFQILRGFLPLDQTDHQSQKRQLEEMVGWINDGQLPKQLRKGSIQPDQNLIMSRFEFTYKNKLEQTQLLGFSVYVLSNLLSILPINISCSYTGKSFYYPDQNQIVLIWLSCHKTIEKLVHTNNQELQQVVNEGSAFLRQKALENIKDSSQNVADQMLKSSLKVLSKYNGSQEKNKLKEWSNLNQTSKLGNSKVQQSVISEKMKHTDFDRMSVISKVSFKNTISEHGRDARARAEAKFQSLSNPLKAHRDREYAQLLATIQHWQGMYGKVSSFDQVKLEIKKNSEKGRLRYKKQNVTANQSKLFEGLIAIRNYLEVNEFLLLLKYHTEQKQAFFEVLFQNSAGGFLIDLGIRLAKEYAKQLYQVYITQDFKIEPNGLLISFMKKMLNEFCRQQNMESLFDQINVPLMLKLLESGQFRSQTYKQFAKDFIDKLFVSNPNLTTISPFLNQIYVELIQDYHQEFVHSLLADIAFETLYFTYDLGQINNSPYRKDQALKQKKVMQLLRIGGFSSFGFEMKKILIPNILQNANFKLPSALIYEEITIARPLLMGKFIETIIQSHVTQHLTELVSFFTYHLHTAHTVTRAISNAYLCSQIRKFSWQIEPSNTSLNTFKSQSGIFSQLLEYNPQIKIAGRSLSEVVRQHQNEKSKNVEKFDANAVIVNELKLNFEEIYEYILIVQKLKEKYEHYENLSEDQRIYLRQIVHKILGRKDEIMQYLNISALIKLFNGLQMEALF